MIFKRKQSLKKCQKLFATIALPNRCFRYELAVLQYHIQRTSGLLQLPDDRQASLLFVETPAFVVRHSFLIPPRSSFGLPQIGVHFLDHEFQIRPRGMLAPNPPIVGNKDVT